MRSKKFDDFSKSCNAGIRSPLIRAILPPLFIESPRRVNCVRLCRGETVERLHLFLWNNFRTLRQKSYEGTILVMEKLRCRCGRLCAVSILI